MVLTKIPGPLIVDDAITSAKITDTTITNAKMAVDPSNASNLSSGDVPLAQLGNVPVADLSSQADDIALLAFKTQANGNLSRYNLVDQVVDAFEDATGVDAGSSTSADRNTTGKYYSGSGTQISAHTTVGNSTWTSPSNLSGGTVRILVVGGGSGSSGDGYSVGGSGGGGVVEIGAYVTAASQAYGITVGAGGGYMPFPWSGNGNPAANNGVGNAGTNSIFDTAGVGTGPITGIAGGVGRLFSYRDSDWPGGTWVSGAGGSGGGGGGDGPYGNQKPGGATVQPSTNGGHAGSGFGFAGGNGETNNPPGGAGGGAGGAGQAGDPAAGGANQAGGDGGYGRFVSWATAYGDSGYFGGGGGGGSGGSGAGGLAGQGGGGMGGGGGYPGNNAYPNTYITDNIDASQTTIPVNDLGSWPTNGTFQIGTSTNKLNEIITYTGKSVGSGAGNFTGCTRGIDYTTAASASTNAVVYCPPQGGCGLPNTGGGAGGSKNDNYGASGGSGVVLIEYSTLGDMTLVSTATTAEAAPTKGDIVFTYTNGAGTAVLGTNITAEISMDNGSTWTDFGIAPADSQGTTGGHTIVTKNGVTLTSTSGTSMRYRIKTLVQSAVMQTRIHAVSLGWS